MKKIGSLFAIIFIVVLGITVFVILQVDSSYIYNSKKLKTTLYSNYETLKEVLEDSETPDEVIDFLYNWGEENDFEVQLDNNNLLITKNSSEFYYASPTITLHVDIDLTDKNNLAQTISIATTTLLTSEDFGEVNVLFTPSNNLDYYGAENTSSKFLDSEYFLSLRHNEDSGIISKTPSEVSYSINSNIEYSSPSYDFAYKITLSGLNLSNTSYNIYDYNNPIMEFGTFMSNLNDSSIYFEFAEFESETDSRGFPSTTSVILLFDERNSEKFLTRAESLEEKFDNEYKEAFPNYSFTYTEVSPPTEIISQEDGLRILGFLYTVVERLYEQNEDSDDNVLSSIAIVNGISTIDNFSTKITGYSISHTSELDQIEDMEKSANVSNFNISTRIELPKWIAQDESLIYSELSLLLENEGVTPSSQRRSFIPSSLGIISSLSPESTKLIYNTNNAESFEQTTALMNFIRNIDMIDTLYTEDEKEKSQEYKETQTKNRFELKEESLKQYKNNNDNTIEE